MQQSKTIKLTETEATIIKMLKQSTGFHFLDSGGMYGRQWQKNQGRDFKSEPEITLEVWSDQLIIYKNVFHFLIDHLEITKKSKKYQKLFDVYEKGHYSQYLKKVSDEIEEYAKEMGYITKHDKSWLTIMEEFGKLHGDESWTVNTYNFENLVSQILQYTIFENEEGCFIILQVHNGCDVRSGYTIPKIFELDDPDRFIIDMSDIRAGCKCYRWYSDDSGYNWYLDYEIETDKTKQLDLFENEAQFKREFIECVELDEENQKVICKRCKQALEFW